eukprot:TRINITY_DN15021_c0_g1_i1.p1 TRINITY_DN15021_c0_g1~~TRINITY_DN15021_c0_g1_i1.p1  ORF type:complete len:137 (-),score=0.37 TRINITY_DN15021_c0_g1_i1:350-760(-)
MRRILFVLFLYIVIAYASEQPQWTALQAKSGGSCSANITGYYQQISLATDSKGRIWQFGGLDVRCESGMSASQLRYFDRDTKIWNTVWTRTEGFLEPSSRSDSVMWIDKDDNIYILGGEKITGNFNGFWKYSPESN